MKHPLNSIEVFEDAQDFVYGIIRASWNLLEDKCGYHRIYIYIYIYIYILINVRRSNEELTMISETKPWPFRRERSFARGVRS